MAAGSEAGSCVRAARADSEPKISRPTRPLRDAPRPRSCRPNSPETSGILRPASARVGESLPWLVGFEHHAPELSQWGTEREPREAWPLPSPWASRIPGRRWGPAAALLCLSRCFLHVPFSSSPLLERVFRDLKKLFLIWELETEQAC